MNIDWSKAPSSATHVRPESDGKCELWLKQVQGEWFFTMTGRSFWTRLNDAFKDFSVLIERPSWSGPEDGLPPVGTACEVRDDLENIREVEIIAHTKRGGAPVAVYQCGDEIGAYTASLFHPIRTPEQIAAEERERAVMEIYERANKQGGSVLSMLMEAYDAGCLKVDS